MSDDGQYAFISYSSKNQQMADSVRLLFREEGIPCWMAPYDIPAGSKYAFVINDALEKCGCLVLLLTNASQESQFVEREIERAITYRKPIIPMQLEYLQLNSGFKFYIGNSQIIAVPEIRQDAPEFQRALEGIRKFVGCTKKNSKLPTIASRTMEEKSISQRWALQQVVMATEKQALLRISDKGRPSLVCDLFVKTIRSENGKRPYPAEDPVDKFGDTLPEELKRNRNTLMPLSETYHHWEEESRFGCDLLLRCEPVTTLQQLLDQEKQFTEDEIVKLGQDICNALSTFHAIGYSGYSISPESICVNRYGAWKMIPFDVSADHNLWPSECGSVDVRRDILRLSRLLFQLSCNSKQLFAGRPENALYSTHTGHALRRILERACEGGFASVDTFCAALINVNNQEHRTPSILQRDITECGAASLAMIFAYWGKSLSLDQICNETNVSPDGCNAGDLMRAAKRLGMDCHGYRKKPEELSKLPMPCILHWDFCHFLVLEDIRDEIVYLNDPASGHKEITMEELNVHFSGVVLTFQPK